MSVTSTAQTVTTTRSVVGTPKTTRRQLIVYPDASVTVYIGGSNVTAANGAPLAPGAVPFNVYAGWNGDQSASQGFYAITASGSAACPVLEIAY